MKTMYRRLLNSKGSGLAEREWVRSMITMGITLGLLSDGIIIAIIIILVRQESPR